MKIYKVQVCGWMDLVYSKLYSKLEPAERDYQIRVEDELNEEKTSALNDSYPYSKNDVDLYEYEDDENGEFHFVKKLAVFEGDHS